MVIVIKCGDCSYLKSKPVGYVSRVWFCGKKKGVGINPIFMNTKPHPKCPLKSKH